MKRHLVRGVVIHSLDDVDLAIIRPGISFCPDTGPNLRHDQDYGQSIGKIS